jgi:hypothetical protein
MAARLTKRIALKLFCIFRQAERSVDHALGCSKVWSQFVAYYDGTKRTQIAELIGFLKDTRLVRERTPSRKEFEIDRLWILLWRAAAGLWNPYRRYWKFDAREITFFFATLEHLLRLLEQAEFPGHEELIDLRMDCYGCHGVIGMKLVGISEIQKAKSIEHFHQSVYVRPVTFKDLDLLGSEK